MGVCESFFPSNHSGVVVETCGLSPFVRRASSNGRLGIRRDHPAFQTFHANYEGVNQPVRLPLDAGVGIVDLHASGYGFVGLDTAGGIWVWGQSYCSGLRAAGCDVRVKQP